MVETKEELNISDECLKIDKSWVHVGTVMSIHVQSLLAGRTIVTKDYKCKNVGLTAICNNAEAIRKNMFVIYNAENNCIQRETLYQELQDLKIINLSQFKVRFEAPNMSDTLLVNVFKLMENSKHVLCKTSFKGKYLVEVDCIDCGEEAAIWISTYLNKSNLRLAYASDEPVFEASNFWNRLDKLHELEVDKRNIVIPFNAIPRYTLMSYQSLMEINRTSECHLTLEQFDPDICIMPQSMDPFGEFEWEWILIGNAIMKNFQPWDRLIIEPMNMPIDMKINMMLLHCELQQAGSVKVGDKVYVRRTSKKKLLKKNQVLHTNE